MAKAIPKSASGEPVAAAPSEQPTALPDRSSGGMIGGNGDGVGLGCGVTEGVGLGDGDGDGDGIT